MKPIHLNLLALSCCVVIAFLVYMRFGRGPYLEAATLLFSLGSFVQFAMLGWAARNKSIPPAFLSTWLLALWLTAGFPFLLLDRPEFPSWMIFATPLIFLMAYGMFSLLLLMFRRLPRWP